MLILCAGRLLTVEGQGVKTDLTLVFAEVAKTPGLVTETGVLVSVPLGVVSSAYEPQGIAGLTVGRQKSSHSKIRVT